MSSFLGKPFARARAHDPGGHRLLGLTEEGHHPIFGPKGHALLASAAGGGKTTCGAMPWLLSLAASEPEKATLIFDCKNGEIALQAATMFAAKGRIVRIIDDMNTCPGLAQFRVQLNAFGSASAAYKRDPREVLYANETITHALLEEPAGDAKNRYWRDDPRGKIAFANNVMLARNPDRATPGAAASILSDPDMMLSLAEIEAEEGTPMLQAQARDYLASIGHEHHPQHMTEAKRALRHFAPGTLLHDAGQDASITHADLIREGAIIFLVGPMAHMNRLGSYFALHINAFCDALYSGAGALRVIADEFTNIPLKSLVESLTTLRAYSCEVYLIYQSRSEVIRRFGKLECETIEENCIVKQWFGFSSFAEAERISKAMGNEHAVATSLSGDSHGLKTQTNLSLIKQPRMSPAELMAMPRTHQLIHIKGLGFVLALTVGQHHIAPYCDLLAPNPLEGGVLQSDPKITLVTPDVPSSTRGGS